MPGRERYLAKLKRAISPQLTTDTSLEIFDDERALKILGMDDANFLTIGHKRQAAIREVKSEYIAFFDDDDLPSHDYIEAVNDALDEKPDVVGFKLRCFRDGCYIGEAIHSVKCMDWSQERTSDGGMRYLRTPNHLNPMRRELALDIGYKPMMRGEDADFSTRLYRKHGATMKERFIDGYLYDYLYRSPGRRMENVTVYA